MKSGIQIKGLPELLKKLDRLPDEVKQIVDDELTASANEIEDMAKMLAPVDLGALRNSISVTRNEPLLKQVSATVSYAAYQEFGTGGFVNVPNAPEGIQQYALQFKGRGIRQVNIPAQPYFFPAVNAATVELVKRIKQAIENKV